MLNLDLPQPTCPLAEMDLADMHLAGDMLQTLGLAAAAGIGTALASGFVVMLLALSAT